MSDMYTFIINPNARTGLGLKVWNSLELTLKEKNVSYRAFLTKYRSHATGITKKVLLENNRCTLIVLGGDGTVNEVINGISDFSAVTLAYIPIGSSNDFARGMNLSADPHTALEHILSPSRFVNLSVGTTSYGSRKRFFAVSSGFGFDAEVCCRIGTSFLKAFLNRLSLGKFSYVSIAVSSLLLQTPKRMVLTLDGKKTVTFKKVYFAAAMNQKFEGGGFMFCPKASPTDDFLDIIVAEGLPKLKILCLLPTAFWGKHTKFSGIHIYRCRSVMMESEIPLPLHTDGEPISKVQEINISQSTQKIRFIIS